jgi:hypothetical protein
MVQSYTQAVFQLAAEWGIDRIPDGRRAIHEWCMWNAATGTGVRASQIGVGWSFSGMLPDVGEDIWGQRVEHIGPNGETRTVVFGERVPIVRIALEDAWHARDESRVEARERIMRRLGGLVDAELSRLQSGYESAGYVFPDTRPNLQRDMQWLFRRIGRGEWIAAIASGDGVPESTVRSAISKLAHDLNVRLDDL